MQNDLIPRRTLLVLGAIAYATRAVAQPAASGRPIRLIVPLPAGTATDLAARVLGQQMTAVLGQPVIVDNKPGANGVIGTLDLVRSPPDGLTLMLGSQSPLASNVALVKNLQYDPRKDFTPINGFGETMHVLMTSLSSPMKSLDDFIAQARQNPGRISVGSSTSTNLVQIGTLQKMAGIELLTVPYKGVPATITDLIGGTLDTSLIDLANAIAQAKAGKLRPLGLTSLKRSPLVPTWPAISETLPGYDLPSYVAMIGPAGLPRPLVDRLNAAVAQALRNPELADKLATIGMTPMPMTPDEFKALIAADVTKWVRLAKEANVQPE